MEKIFETVDDDGAWPAYKLTLGSGELKLIATWHSLTPDPARSCVCVGGGGGGGGAYWHQCFVLKQDILISRKRRLLPDTDEESLTGMFIHNTNTHVQTNTFTCVYIISLILRNNYP